MRQRKQKRFPKSCPKCDSTLKRKGRGKKKYLKCTQCKTKYSFSGVIIEDGFQDPVLKESMSKNLRREIAKIKFIKWCKKKKYYPFKAIEFGGEIINLDDFEKDGRKKRKRKRTRRKRRETIRRRVRKE